MRKISLLIIIIILFQGCNKKEYEEDIASDFYYKFKNKVNPSSYEGVIIKRIRDKLWQVKYFKYCGFQLIIESFNHDDKEKLELNIKQIIICDSLIKKYNLSTSEFYKNLEEMLTLCAEMKVIFVSGSGPFEFIEFFITDEISVVYIFNNEMITEKSRKELKEMKKNTIKDFDANWFAYRLKKAYKH